MKKKKEIIEHSSGDKITINELFEDDPKILRKIEELREWLEENPGLFDFPEGKRTQGQEKMKQLLEDARRSNQLRDQLEKVARSSPGYSVDDLEKLYTKYVLFLSELKSFRKEFLYSNPAYKTKLSLCKKYGIQAALFDALLAAFREGRLEGWDFTDETSGDVCGVEEPRDEDKIVDIHTFHTEVVDCIEDEIYPVKIKIHRFASQRDIMDFVEKNWNLISANLEEKRIKQRKIPREITDYIWKHKEEGPKKIEALVRKKYPRSSLLYYEISKIIAEEQKRRKLK